MTFLFLAIHQLTIGFGMGFNQLVGSPKRDVVRNLIQVKLFKILFVLLVAIMCVCISKIMYKIMRHNFKITIYGFRFNYNYIVINVF